MKPSEEAEFGIISDLDDTILHTGVASCFKMEATVKLFYEA